MNNNSLFSNGNVVTSFKKFPAYVLDFIITIVYHLILFACLEGIMNVTPFVSSLRDTMNHQYDGLVTTVCDTHISKKNERGDLVDRSTLLDEYIHGAVLNSLQENNYEGISTETYKDYQAINQTNDYAFRYFIDFKPTNIDDFESDAITSYGKDYYNKLFLEPNAQSQDEEEKKKTLYPYFQIEETSGYPLMTFDTAKQIDNYFRDRNYSQGKTVFDEITRSYENTLTVGFNDIQAHYIPYQILQMQYEKNSQKMFIIKLVELSVTYALAILLSYFVMPMILKDGRTLSMKILSLGASSRNGGPIKWWQNLLKSAITIFEFACMIPITAVIFFQTGGIDITAYPLFGGISFLSLGAFSIVFMFFSFLLSFVMRETRQTIPEYLTNIAVKGSDVFYVKTKVDENEDGNSKQEPTSDRA